MDISISMNRFEMERQLEMFIEPVVYEWLSEMRIDLEEGDELCDRLMDSLVQSHIKIELFPEE